MPELVLYGIRLLAYQLLEAVLDIEVENPDQEIGGEKEEYQLDRSVVFQY